MGVSWTLRIRGVVLQGMVLSGHGTTHSVSRIHCSIRFGGKEYIFLDLDCVRKILKVMRFRMHFLLKKNLLKSSLLKSG